MRLTENTVALLRIHQQRANRAFAPGATTKMANYWQGVAAGVAFALRLIEIDNPKESKDEALVTTGQGEYARYVMPEDV